MEANKEQTPQSQLLNIVVMVSVVKKKIDDMKISQHKIEPIRRDLVNVNRELFDLLVKLSNQ